MLAGRQRGQPTVAQMSITLARDESNSSATSAPGTIARPRATPDAWWTLTVVFALFVDSLAGQRRAVEAAEI